MPPIPIYADAPITAAKADGVTPQTAPPPTRTTELPATTTSTGNSNYPATQPGAAAGPAPTGSVSRQLPSAPAPAPAPTSTTSIQTDGPPPPQPGAVPMPFTTASHSNGYNPSSPAAPRAQPMPHQLNIPPPTTSALPTHSTVSASSTSPSHRPTTLPMGPVHSRPTSISTHPPGYQQNPYAAEMTSAQRASLEAAEAADKGRKSGRNSISEWIAGEDDGFGSPATTGGTATAWLKGVASQASQWANKANEMASKKLG
ncbi:hypothetical protein E4T45_13235 [Aureobasidium sp. EXF-8846]|nr:hypothetical protein E4T45_13235 [Aureobasidium sp. EXF-8846]